MCVCRRSWKRDASLHVVDATQRQILSHSTLAHSSTANCASNAAADEAFLKSMVSGGHSTHASACAYTHACALSLDGRVLTSRRQSHPIPSPLFSSRRYAWHHDLTSRLTRTLSIQPRTSWCLICWCAATLTVGSCRAEKMQSLQNDYCSTHSQPSPTTLSCGKSKILLYYK